MSQWKVLLADDNQAVRQVLTASLQPHGFAIIPAGSGPEALSLARAEQPDLLLLDVSMPQMNGIEVCRRLQADPRTARCKVIMLTASSAYRDQVAAQEAGAIDYVVKPFSPATLLARVRQALA